MYDLAETHSFLIDTYNDKIIPLDGDPEKISINTLPTEDEFQVDQAQYTYCKTATFQRDCQEPELYFDRHGL